MKILIINTVRFSLNGMAVMIMNYYDAMDRDGIEYEFMAIGEPIEEYKKMFAERNIKYHVIRKTNIPQYILQISRLVKRGGYDAVHIHGNSALMVVELIGCVLGGAKIRIVHGHNTSARYPMAHKLMYPLFNMLLTQRFACGSDAGKWLYRKKPFTVIRNGIDLKKYMYDCDIRTEYRKKINAGEKFVVGHIGNFIEQKNHTFLLDFAHELCKKGGNFMFLLFSEGYLLDEMKEKARRLGIEDSVLFAGRTAEIEKYFQAMDIFVLPSLHEGLPVSMVEAQASGLKCIASDAVSRESDLTGNVEFLPIDNAEVWADAIFEYSKKKQNRSEQSANACSAISEKGYDINRNAAELKKLLLKLNTENK